MIRRGVISEFDLGQDQIVRINDVIREHGFETACTFCFVDAKRFRQAKVADDFVNMYNGLVKSLAGLVIMACAFIGAAFIAIGMLISSLTENQLAAAVGTVAILLFLVLISLLNSLISVYWIRFVLSSISVFARFQNFTQGVFDIAALVYYLSVSVVFLYLTVRVFEKRRWG